MICSIYRKFLLWNKSNSIGAASGYKDSWGTEPMQDLSTWRVFADCKNSASECNESSLSNCRAQPILSKSLYSSSADDISAGTELVELL